MNVFETLPYLVKVNLYWLLFYACYWLLFRKHTFFKSNRLFLIGSLLISWILPMIELPADPISDMATYMPKSTDKEIFTVQSIPSNPSLSETNSGTVIEWSQILVAFYTIGLVVMLVQFVRALLNLRKIITDNSVIHFDKYSLVLLNEQCENRPGSFSFLKWLFLTKEDYEHHLDTILNHELVHIKQRHSWDILLIELLKIAFWFNPVIWFFKYSIQEVHEFLADEQAANKNTYSSFLVSYALNPRVQSLTNHFFNSRLLKIRIFMIYKHRTPKWLMCKYMLVVPVIILAVSLSAARKHDTEKKSVLTSITTPLISVQPADIPAPTQQKTPILPAAEPKVQPQTNGSQTVSVKGVILDKDNHAITSAIVVVKNSTVGTATDEKGEFELKNIPENSTLAVTHLHYKPAEILIESGKTEYKQVLEKKDANSLHEVVVVAYIPARSSEKSSQEGKSEEFRPVESYPEFPGGADEMYKYIARNVKYPTRASKAHIQGRVVLSFTIDVDGKTSDAKIVKGLGYGLDEEAVRVIYNMPKWNPALQNGKPISMEYSIPIMFSLEEEKAVDKRQGFLDNAQKVNTHPANQEKATLLKSTLNSPFAVNPSTLQSSNTQGNYRYNTGSVIKE